MAFRLATQQTRVASSSRRLFSTVPVDEWVKKLNSANRAEEVKDVLSGMKARYPEVNVVFRKELPKRPAPEPLAPGLIERFQLNLPSRYVPLLGGTFAGLTLSGLYVMDEQTMLAYVFCMYAGVAFAKLRKPVMDYVNTHNKQMLEALNKVENKKIDRLKAAQAEQVENSSLFTEIDGIPVAKQTLKQLQAYNQVEASKAELKNKVHRALEAVSLLQERLQVEQSRELIAKANQTVLKELQSEASKKKQFEAAIATLKNAKATGAQPQPVNDLFVQYFQKVKKDQQGKPVTVNPELKKKIQEVLSTVGLKAVDEQMTKFAKA